MTRPLLNIPTAKYDPAKAARICELLSQGITLAQIMRDYDDLPSRWSIHRWMASNPEFKTAYEMARDVGYDAIADDIMNIAEDGSADWVVRKKRNGEEYTVVDAEAVARSKLRVYAREKLLASWSPRYRPQSGIQLSNPEGGPVEFTDAAASAKIASLLALAQARAAGEPEDGSDLA